MADDKGILIASNIIPAMSDGAIQDHATHIAKYGKGGWREVATIQERDAITDARCDLGMSVYVTSEGKLYILSDLDTTTTPYTKTWTEFKSGSTDSVRKTADFATFEPMFEGEVVQYIGTTNQNYTHGYFYKHAIVYTDNSVQTKPLPGERDTDYYVDTANFLTFAEEHPNQNLQTNTQYELTYRGGYWESSDSVIGIPTSADVIKNRGGIQNSGDQITLEVRRTVEWKQTNVQPQTDLVWGNITGTLSNQTDLQNALDAKQDTLTAGTNITIEEDAQTGDLVISSTAQESFFRGKFSTWDTVPTDYRSYYPDYTGSTKPTRTDYMVIEDPSSYVKPGMPIQIYNKPMSGGTAFARFVFGVTDITLNHNEVSQKGAEGIIIGTVGNQLKITYASEVWKVTPLDTPVIVDGVTKPINEIALQWHYANPSQETLYKEINFIGQGGYKGTWRFSYQSNDWDTSGKNGWEPEYQIEDVLPIATDQVAGISKIYGTTGQNTDGSMTQKAITDALSNKSQVVWKFIVDEEEEQE